MPVSVERDVDAGVSHLTPNIGGRLAVGDQLAREKVAEAVKPCSRQFSLLNDRLPDETCWFLAADFDKKTWEYERARCLGTFSFREGRPHLDLL